MNKIIFYKKQNGTVPVQDFLDSLPLKDRKKMLRTIGLLKSEGINLREPNSSHIGNKIYELRSKVSTNIQRVFYFCDSGNEFVLLHGFTKKTQNTPPAEIARAEKYRKDYMDRAHS